MTVATLVKSWNDCNTFEQMQRHFLKIGVSVVFIIGFTMPFVHFAWLMVVCVFCSQLFSFGFLLHQSRDGQPFFTRV